MGSCLHFLPFCLYLSSRLSTLSISPATDTYLLFTSDNDLFRLRKHIFTSSWCRGKAKTNRGRCAFASALQHPALLQPVSRNFSDEIFVSGSASCGYCSTVSPPNRCSPAALYSPYLSSLDFPPRHRASSRLLSAAA